VAGMKPALLTLGLFAFAKALHRSIEFAKSFVNIPDTSTDRTIFVLQSQNSTAVTVHTIFSGYLLESHSVLAFAFRTFDLDFLPTDIQYLNLPHGQQFQCLSVKSEMLQ
jgi:hypothetical protein